MPTLETMAEAPKTEQTTKAPGGKGKSTKKVAKKPAAKKAETNGKSGPTIRERVFKLLAKHADGLTGSQIQEKLELGGIPSLLKDEGMSDKPRIKRHVSEEHRGVLYLLTAAGRKAVEDGTVDANAAPSASGKEWPNGR